MRQEKGSAQKTINTIRRKTQRKHASEEKIRVVLEGLLASKPGPGFRSSHMSFSDTVIPIARRTFGAGSFDST